MKKKVPGKPDGPGGMLILCENFLIFKNAKCEKRVPYPVRVGSPSDRSSLMVSYACFKLKVNN